jgi:glycosyltransferase involved in cell wall biosynthesis
VLSGVRVAVVVPAFNEERWLDGTLRAMPGFVDEIVVVDDGSADRTCEVARHAGGRVLLVRHPENCGVGAAIATGYRRARDRGAGVVAVMAGDGQMHPGDLERVALPVARGELDYVKGDRLRHPDVWRAMPRVRLAGILALTWLTRHAAGLPRLGDSQCGFTAISGRAIDALDLDALWPSYGYPNDLLGALAREGLRIGEVVVRPVYRGEASGLRPWHAATIGFVVARVAYRRLRGRGDALGPAAASPSPSAGARTSPADGRARPTSPRTLRARA